MLQSRRVAQGLVLLAAFGLACKPHIPRRTEPVTPSPPQGVKADGESWERYQQAYKMCSYVEAAADGFVDANEGRPRDAALAAAVLGFVAAVGTVGMIIGYEFTQTQIDKLDDNAMDFEQERGDLADRQRNIVIGFGIVNTLLAGGAAAAAVSASPNINKAEAQTAEEASEEAGAAMEKAESKLKQVPSSNREAALGQITRDLYEECKTAAGRLVGPGMYQKLYKGTSADVRDDLNGISVTMEGKPIKQEKAKPEKPKKQKKQKPKKEKPAPKKAEPKAAPKKAEPVKAPAQPAAPQPTPPPAAPPAQPPPPPPPPKQAHKGSDSPDRPYHGLQPDDGVALELSPRTGS